LGRGIRNEASMMYRVKISFATLRGPHCAGELCGDIEDAENLVAAGIIEPVEPVEVAPVEAVIEDEPKPTTKRGRK
jgi:hypothetical protein